jgi:phosphatidylserine/phosphatidylglycerophosphate/cardiolipin synthase-like enzyme
MGNFLGGFMKNLCKFLLLVFIVLVFFSFNQNPKIKVYLAPTGAKQKLQRAIISELKNARKQVLVAMFQFTSISLANELMRLHKKGVDVKILLDKFQVDRLTTHHKRAFEVIKNAKLNYKLVDLAKNKADAGTRPKFHHKFCVIDKKVIITGSYNWTVLADKHNYENLIVIEDKNTANQYVKHFMKVWKDKKITK